MNKTEFPGGGGLGLCGCEKSFKGVETFLKRIAFNLGNSPSQTEVKIISCIPIDVSDLQQKILYLERQLEEAKCCNSKSATSQKRIVGSALCEPKIPATSQAGVSCNTADMNRLTNLYDNPNKKKSNVSFIVPSISPQDCGNSYSSQQTEERYIADNNRYREFLPYDNDPKLYTISQPKQREARKNFFRKKKKSVKNKKPKAHYVYYTQASNTPFNKSDGINEVTDETLTRSYLAEMIKKQYKPKTLGGNLSDISKFTSPVCRDQHDNGFAYESDVCSCCHGNFHNTDNRTIKNNDAQVYRANEYITQGGYYDSTFYDVIPVKEKSVRIKKASEILKKRELKPVIDIKCWPEDVRQKLCTYPMYNPLYSKYYNSPLSVESHIKKDCKISKREPVIKNTLRRKKEQFYTDNQVDAESLRRCCVDFGDFYPKLMSKPKEDKCIEAARVPPKTDVECFTNIINNSACQTTSSCSDVKELTLSNDKTDEMLSQIKTILQSVLQQVKDTNLPKENVTGKLKRDAIVQKGSSQGNMTSDIGSMQDNLQANYLNNLQSSFPGMLQGNIASTVQGSRLLNSFTYSPYNLDPYLPSCSKHLNPSQYYYPPPAMKCFQNFPLFVQNPGRHMCASCYRHCAPVKSNYAKHAATTATNTDDVKAQRSKETEKLIKDIYKSMALNIGPITGDNSLIMNEFENQDYGTHVSTKKIVDKPTPVKECKKISNVVQAVSELFRKKNMVISSESPNTTTESRIVSNGVSTGSQMVTTTTDLEAKLRRERLEKFLNQSKHGQSIKSDKSRPEKRKMQCTGTQNTMTPNISDTETTSSDTDTDVTYVPHHSKQVTPREKKEKTSLFSKMFKSVKLFKQKDRKRVGKVETPQKQDSSSDSDDYQTIYSQKIETVAKQSPRAQNLNKRHTHSKISYKQTYQRDRSPEKLNRRTPYMEQEYRRHWNENLTFHDYRENRNEHRYSSEHPYSGESHRRSPYYQTYEARPTMVENNNIPPRVHNVNVRRHEKNEIQPRMTAKGLAWLKKHKMGIHCGEQWKKLILEG